MANLWVHRYLLRAGARLNAASQRKEFPGALIRTDSGFACLHPWPELGDPSLEASLRDLAEGRPNPLVRQALHCAKIDGDARAKGRSLFEGIAVPRSHATLPSLDRAQLENAHQAGFTTVKLKAPDLAHLRDEMKHQNSLCFRLDYNGTADLTSLLTEFSEWSMAEKARLDFLEDPVPYQAETWRKLARELEIPLANDRSAERDQGSDFVILKPALTRLEDFPQSHTRKIVTSYMDHPLGQSFAAVAAGRAQITEICGLQTHGLFEKDAFTEQLGPITPDFTAPAGTGLGFDHLLEALPWQKL